MEPHRLIDYINKHVALTTEETEKVIAKVNFRKYLKGQFVLQQGDICQHENFVMSGCLKTFYVDENGDEHIAMFAIEDWWCADLGSFVNQTPAQYNVQCLEPCTLAQFSAENQELLFSEVPKMERFFRIILQNAFIASQKRIINTLSLSAEERYQQFRLQYPQIEQRVPQYLIASYLGFTPEFLSKIRAKIIREQ